MQAVMNNVAGFGIASRIHLARGRDYMMRSEKRGSMKPASSGGSGKKPPKRRRRRAGFFYKLLTLLLLLLVWPVGLLLLWRRRLRWSAGTKLLTSVVTLAACVILIGFLLTVNTGNARYSAIQNSINDFLDDAADSLVVVWEEVETQAMIVSNGVQDLSESAWISARERIADGIDAGVVIGKDVRATIEGWIDGNPDEDASKAEVSTEPEASTTPEVSAEATAAPQTEALTVAELSVNTDADSLPVYLPEGTPDGGRPIASGTLTRSGEIDTEAAPEALNAAEADADEAQVFTVKPAAEATVYYNEGGKCYHMTDSCGSMSSAVEHTLGETLESSVHRCSACKTPDKAMLNEEYIVWTDANNTAHLSDDCAKFSGRWNIIPADDAIEQSLVACYECDADQYLAAIAMKLPVEAKAPEAAEAATASEEAEIDAVAEEASEEAEADAIAEEASEKATTPESTATSKPTATPESTVTPKPTATPEPTPSPTPEVAEPAATLKPAGLATVYHSGNGQWYHTHDRCSGMTGADPYTLAECVNGGYKCCNACGAPKAELVDEDCLWMDDNEMCHISDECALFVGQYSLIARDTALLMGFLGCEECGANEYLIPETAVHFDDILVVDLSAQ